jgi:hypothetical protein
MVWYSVVDYEDPLQVVGVTCRQPQAWIRSGAEGVTPLQALAPPAGEGPPVRDHERFRLR